MQKTFDDYLNEVEKSYHYRIKTVSRLTDLDMAKVENALRKYVVKSISPVRRTIIQDHPLDFQDIVNTEVYIVDVATGCPASSYVLQQEIRLALNIPEKFIVVRGENEPIEMETQRAQTMSALARVAATKGLVPAATLSTSADTVDNGYDGADLYGDKYNGLFLTYLASVRRERQLKIDPPMPLFSNFDMPDMPVGGENFNKDMKVLVKPVSGSVAQTAEPMAAIRSRVGNFDDNTRRYLRFYQDAKGKKVGLERRPDPIRKEDSK